MTPQQRQRIQTAIAKMNAGITERNRVIADIYSEGNATLAEIADAAGMTAMGIQKIIKKTNKEQSQ